MTQYKDGKLEVKKYRMNGEDLATYKNRRF